jgi:peptide/nickel transport system substrate-binding protein
MSSRFVLRLAALGLACGTAFNAFAQEITEISREKTVIFETTQSRVAIPKNMNPYNTGQNLDQGMWQATQESLFYNNIETGELMPWLAESYAFNADATEVTIKLRPGVKWADGVDFTSEDVVFTVEMLKAKDGLRYSADMNTWVKSVSAPDAHTVVFSLTKPNLRFVIDYFGVRVWSTLLIAPKHVWKDVDPLTFTNFDVEKGWPLGTGPYKMVRSTENESVYDKRRTWWAADAGFARMPKPERLIWIGLGNEDARAAALSNNQLDAAWDMGRATFEMAVQRNPNVIAWTKELPYAYLDACPRQLSINNAQAPFDSAEARQALNYALNREQIAQIVTEGVTGPSLAPFPAYPPLQAFLDRKKAVYDTYPIGKQDLAVVEKRMTDLGYAKNGDGFWAKDGKLVEVPIIGRGQPDILKTGPVLVSQLRKAGFDASFRQAEDAVYYGDIGKGTATAWISGACGSVTEPYAAFALYDSKNALPVGEAANFRSASRYKNPELDAILAEMAKLAPDSDAFKAEADKALAIWIRDLPAIPLTDTRLLTPFSTTYWKGWPTAENNYVQPGHWWVTANQIILKLEPAN